MVTQRDIELADSFMDGLTSYIANPMRGEYSAELSKLIADYVAQETKALRDNILAIADEMKSEYEDNCTLDVGNVNYWQNKIRGLVNPAKENK